MWGVLIGLYIALMIYPFFDEWQQDRANKAALKKMRASHAAGRRWDVAKGQWEDDGHALGSTGSNDHATRY
jgi:hypothetical protein